MTALAESRTDPGADRFPPATVNGRLLEAILRHRHFVLRVENGVARDLLAPLTEARREIMALLADLAARDELTSFQRLQRARLLELERRVANALSYAMRATLSLALSRFESFAQREAEIQARLLRREIPDGVVVDLAGPSAARIEAIVQGPLGGRRWANRMAEAFGLMTRKMQLDLATSVTLGEGMDDAARRLSRSLEHVGRRRLVLIARTELQRIANETAVASYRQNRSVVRAVQVWATLDRRTCLICAGRDRSVYPLTERVDLPPYHAACRCFAAPVTRSLEELGIAHEFGASTRASMDGQVPATVAYPEWFARQPASFQREWLGPSRYDAYRSGGLQITDMARDLRVLRIDELPLWSLN